MDLHRTASGGCPPRGGGRRSNLRLAPQTRIILCSSSGVTRAELHGTAGDPPFHAYLHKPTRTDHFREVVGRLLEGAPVSLDRRGAMDVDSSLAQQHPLRILWQKTTS